MIQSDNSDIKLTMFLNRVLKNVFLNTALKKKKSITEMSSKIFSTVSTFVQVIRTNLSKILSFLEHVYRLGLTKPNTLEMYD